LAGLVVIGCASESPLAPDSTAGRSPLTARATTGPDLNGRTNGYATVLSASPPRNNNIVHVPLFIRDAHGQSPATPGAALYETRKHNPVLAPDGHQVTLAEFTAVDGYATVRCVAPGTHATLHLHQLIPNGVYSIWNLVFKAPGFEPTFTNLIGFG